MRRSFILVTLCALTVSCGADDERPAGPCEALLRCCDALAQPSAGLCRDNYERLRDVDNAAATCQQAVDALAGQCSAGPDGGPGSDAGPGRDSGPGTDAGPGTDSGPGIDAGPTSANGLTLRLDRVDYTTSARLVMTIGVAPGGASASLAPTSFSVATSAGLEVIASPRNTSIDVPTCSADLRVTGGASFQCSLLFDIVDGGGAPTELIYQPDERRVAVAISACSSSAPTGYCEGSTSCIDGTCQGACGDGTPDGYCDNPSYTCVSGRVCAPACSPEIPDGVCADGARCVAGDCRGTCSPTEPDGHCERGTCNGGACRSDTTCSQGNGDCAGTDWCVTGMCEVCEPLVPSSGDCIECLQNIDPSITPNPGPECNDCATCIQDGTSFCECHESAACRGCDELPGALRILQRECPTCF